MTRYSILASFGKYGRAWVERADDVCDLESTLRDLIGMQIDRPLRVVADDPDEGWSRDVSEDIAREIAARHASGEKICEPLRDFIALHCGEVLANELNVAA